MTSKRSFVNIMKEDMKRRIWPLALSIVGFFFALPVLSLILAESLNSGFEPEFEKYSDVQFNFICTTIGPQNYLAISGLVIMAFLSAIHGMRYLHSKQEADLYGSLPVLRSEKYSAAYLNGLLLVIVPFLIMVLMAALFGAMNGLVTASGLFFGLQTAFLLICSFMLIYTFVICAAILTGHSAITFAGSLVLMFAPLVYVFIIEGYGNRYFMNKYDSFNTDWLFYLSPFSFMTHMLDSHSDEYVRGVYNADNFIFAVAAIALSIILFILCRYILNIRPSESAGKAMAFEKSKPVIKLMIMVPVALGFGLMFQTLSDSYSYGWLIFGLITGLLLSQAVIETIYEFDFRASKNHLATLAAGAVLTAAVACFFIFDPTGYDTRLPDIGKVESAAVYIPGINNNLYYDEMYDKRYTSTEDRIMHEMHLTDLDYVYTLAGSGCSFAKEYRFKRHLLGSTNYYPYNAEIAETGFDGRRISVNLRLKSGREFKRSYYINVNSDSDMDAMGNIIDSDEFKHTIYTIFNKDLLPDIEKLRNLTYYSGNYNDSPSYITTTDIDGLFKTLEDDTSKLNLATLQKEAPIGNIIAVYEDEKMHETSINLGYVYPSFSETIAFLELNNVDPQTLLNASEIEHITKTSTDDYMEENSVSKTGKEEIEELLPYLVKQNYSSVNHAVFDVYEDYYYTVYFRNAPTNPVICDMKK